MAVGHLLATGGQEQVEPTRALGILGPFRIAECCWMDKAACQIEEVPCMEYERRELDRSRRRSDHLAACNRAGIYKFKWKLTSFSSDTGIWRVFRSALRFAALSQY